MRGVRMEKKNILKNDKKKEYKRIEKTKTETKTKHKNMNKSKNSQASITINPLNIA